MKPPTNFLDGFGVITTGLKQTKASIKIYIGGTLCMYQPFQYIFFMTWGEKPIILKLFDGFEYFYHYSCVFIFVETTLLSNS